MSSNNAKQVLVILSSSPYGGSLAKEAIDYCLAAAAFEQNIQLLFTGDSVLQLLKDQQPTGISQKNISKMLSALPIYGVDQFYVEQSALSCYGLEHAPLCLPATPVTSHQMSALLADANITLNF
ncbi:sulfurtransferase complex subunit TusC [Alkalimarinus alittae]|uniref:Sulfurtransferase complex subunit TusC n=1 Tax=Alkalimarinus alittae TaxID=2961619 RepID=A0ABY6N7F4_9ALTE|nr:sulfurtransferase complex subunit TusC [Alkalimarinus alittae]UZE97897.1 sulfurtransferase complex subunit TusC [Alkalimarinus alittae]